MFESHKGIKNVCHTWGPHSSATFCNRESLIQQNQVYASTLFYKNTLPWPDRHLIAWMALWSLLHSGTDFFFLDFLSVDMYVGVHGHAHTTVPVGVRGQYTGWFFPSIIGVLGDQTQVKWLSSPCLHHWGILWTQDHYSILILEIYRL